MNNNKNKKKISLLSNKNHYFFKGLHKNYFHILLIIFTKIKKKTESKDCFY